MMMRPRWWMVGLFILIAVAAALFLKSREGLIVDKDVAAKADILSLKTMLIIYSGTNGSYPTTEQGLEVLVKRPETAGASWEQLRSELPEDPWGRAYVYRAGSSTIRDFEIFSLGPDGVESGDDIRLKP